ncbi:hypothetical protein BS78_10G122100 [Paspalum vaginatum]|nr:hypothetical protein BS78_10G122100 [Paspalum vaginatum]
MRKVAASGVAWWTMEDGVRVGAEDGGDSSSSWGLFPSLGGVSRRLLAAAGGGGHASRRDGREGIRQGYAR